MSECGFFIFVILKKKQSALTAGISCITALYYVHQTSLFINISVSNITIYSSEFRQYET